ncbi:uncharacterized protein BDFB_014474, partial [Asbolus verrucosus]
MDHFPFMKDCLKKFNYPKIHSLDDMEIAEIFANANRWFLVSWILKQIDDDFEEIVENASSEDLAEIVYCNGFCNNSEKKQFMNGECDSHIQFEILNKMFTYLNSLSNVKNDDDVKAFSNEELRNLSNFDTNLFPMYGSKNILSTEQRKNKIEEYLKEIEHLQNLIDSKLANELKDAPGLDPNLKSSLSDGVKSLEQCLPNFKRTVLDIIKDRRDTESAPTVHFDENFGRMLELCNENAEVVFNLIKNMNVIMGFKENSNMGTKDFDYNNENIVIMRQLSELCNE